MSTADDFKAPRLFNDKAATLLRRSFMEQVRQGLGALVEWNRESGWDSVHVGPDEESVHAAVLTVRFFVQDNERISLCNMAQLYARLTVGREHADRALELRRRFNEMLDHPTNIAIEEARTLTHRDVMDLFLYGWLSHANHQKAEIMRDLRGTPFFPILQADFAYVVQFLIRTVEGMSQENRHILELRDSSSRSTC
jgi:hypothetical protein